MVQQLPGSASNDPDAWPRVCVLAETITDAELLRLAPDTLIRRLFHEEDVRVFDPVRVTYRCSCGRDRVARMLRMLGVDEVRGIVAERGEVEVGCDFCGRRYVFDSVDAEQLFAADPALGSPPRGGVQ
jgi:molecular chaperone Hsp33